MNRIAASSMALFWLLTSRIRRNTAADHARPTTAVRITAASFLDPREQQWVAAYGPQIGQVAREAVGMSGTARASGPIRRRCRQYSETRTTITNS